MKGNNFKRIILLFIPIFLDLLLHNLFGSVDAIMLIKYDPTHLCENAVGTAGSTLSLLTVLIIICSNGVAIVVGQYLGASRKDDAKKVLPQGVLFNLILGITLMIVFVFFTPFLLTLARTKEEYFELAKDYLSIYAYSIPCMAITAVISANFRANGKPIYVTIVSFACNALNVLLNWIFIFGIGPFPEMGIKGAALGTVLAYVALVTISIILNYVILKNPLIPRKIEKNILLSIIKIGLPSALESFAYTMAAFIVVGAVNSLPLNEVPVRYRINLVLGYIYMFSSALAASNSTLVARYVGAQDYKSAKILTLKTTLVGLSIIITLVTILLIIQRPLFLAIDSTDESLLPIIARVLPILYLLEIGRCINLIVIQGQKASGDVFFPLILGIVSMFLVMAFGSWLFGIICGLGVFGVFLAQALDEFGRGIISLIRWFSNRWQNKSIIKKEEAPNEVPLEEASI